MSNTVQTTIGQLPADWRIVRLGDVAVKIQDGTHFSPQSTSGPYRYVTSKNVRFGRMDFGDCGWISEQEHQSIFARCDVEFGDVLLTKDGANTGNAALNSLNEPFSLLSSVAVIRTDDVSAHSPFVLQYFLAPQGQRRLKDLMAGNAITRLTLEKIKDFTIPLPAVNEQRKIAQILTALDNLIEKTEALIAKYQAVKQGMMHDLFTRGVDAHGQLRPPQAEALDLYKQTELGWVPKEWAIRYLGDISQVGTGVTLGRKLTGSQVVEMPYLRVANVQDGFLDLAEIKTVEVFASEVDRFALQPGDLLLTEGGDFDKLGRGTVWRGQISRCLHQNHVFRVRPQQDVILSDYLAAATASAYGKRYFLISSKQTTNLATINSTQLKAFPVLVPSISEQQRTIAALTAAERRIEMERQHSHKLRLQKTGLMQDLLTGKVRVKVEEAERTAADG